MVIERVWVQVENLLLLLNIDKDFEDCFVFYFWISAIAASAILWDQQANASRDGGFVLEVCYEESEFVKAGRKERQE